MHCPTEGQKSSSAVAALAPILGGLLGRLGAPNGLHLAIGGPEGLSIKAGAGRGMGGIQVGRLPFAPSHQKRR